MKYAIPLLIVLLACVASCGDDGPTPVKPKLPTTDTHLVRDVDYIKNTFFLSTIRSRFRGPSHTRSKSS